MATSKKQYNWLITDSVCYPRSQKIEEILAKEYCWLNGDELTVIVENQDFQWIWAVLSGFDKEIPLSSIIEHPLPYADGYTGFWKNPISIQHPLASVEIVPWDSSLALFICKHRELVDQFMNAYPRSEDLSLYNSR